MFIVLIDQQESSSILTGLYGKHMVGLGKYDLVIYKLRILRVYR